MLLISSSQTSSIMAEKISKCPIYCDFSHFTSISCPCGRNKNFKFNNGGGLLLSVLLFYFQTKFHLDGNFCRHSSMYVTIHDGNFRRIYYSYTRIRGSWYALWPGSEEVNRSDKSVEIATSPSTKFFCPTKNIYIHYI